MDPLQMTELHFHSKRTLTSLRPSAGSSVVAGSVKSLVGSRGTSRAAQLIETKKLPMCPLCSTAAHQIIVHRTKGHAGALSSRGISRLFVREDRFWRLGNILSIDRRQLGKLTLGFSSSYEAGSLVNNEMDSTLADNGADVTSSASEPTTGRSGDKRSLQAVGILAALLGIGALSALALTFSYGGPSALLSIISKSGFPAAFALIFVSEIGDKTFFIAALLAMRHSKWLILVGASGALAVMTVVSVIIGKLFQKVPAQLQTTLPVGEFAAVALLIWFGLRSIKTAWDIPSTPADTSSSPGELGELAEAEEFLKKSNDKKMSGALSILGSAFTLIFVAEWGDRSMLATIALGAAQSPWGVATGAIAGHVLATLLAVLGGELLARYLSEKLIGYFGGFLFLGFAAATLAGVF